MESPTSKLPRSPLPSVPIPIDDPRVFLAAERTLLAWIRTGLAMMGFGFLVARFGVFLREVARIAGGETAADVPQFSLWIGTALVVLGVVATLLAGVEHVRFLRALGMRASDYGVRGMASVATSALLAAIGVVMVVYLIWM